jgi:hypothetical protein
LPPLANCEWKYLALKDSFEIRGRNWDKQKLGKNGQGLLDNLRGCGGTVWGWQFVQEDPNSKYEWIASGVTLIGQRNCIGHAMISAGAPNDGGCVGIG